jgi:hypothetical protein
VPEVRALAISSLRTDGQSMCAAQRIEIAGTEVVVEFKSARVEGARESKPDSLQPWNLWCGINPATVQFG